MPIVPFYLTALTSLISPPGCAPCAWSLDAREAEVRLELLRPRLGEEGVQVWTGRRRRTEV